MICNVQNIELCCSQRTKYHKFKCFQVESTDPNIKLRMGLEAKAKPHKTQVQSAQFL